VSREQVYQYGAVAAARVCAEEDFLLLPVPIANTRDAEVEFLDPVGGREPGNSWSVVSFFRLNNVLTAIGWIFR
jgi:hypothetical protein